MQIITAPSISCSSSMHYLKRLWLRVLNSSFVLTDHHHKTFYISEAILTAILKRKVPSTHLLSCWKKAVADEIRTKAKLYQNAVVCRFESSDGIFYSQFSLTMLHRSTYEKQLCHQEQRWYAGPAKDGVRVDWQPPPPPLLIPTLQWNLP